MSSSKKTYLEMAREAIVSAGVSGASQIHIKKAIQEETHEDFKNFLLLKALKKGVEDGLFDRKKNTFKLAKEKEEKTPKKASPKKKVDAAKKSTTATKAKGPAKKKVGKQAKPKKAAAKPKKATPKKATSSPKSSQKSNK